MGFDTFDDAVGEVVSETRPRAGWAAVVVPHGVSGAHGVGLGFFRTRRLLMRFSLRRRQSLSRQGCWTCVSHFSNASITLCTPSRTPQSVMEALEKWDTQRKN